MINLIKIIIKNYKRIKGFGFLKQWVLFIRLFFRYFSYGLFGTGCYTYGQLSDESLFERSYYFTKIQAFWIYMFEFDFSNVFYLVSNNISYILKLPLNVVSLFILLIVIYLFIKIINLILYLYKIKQFNIIDVELNLRENIVIKKLLEEEPITNEMLDKKNYKRLVNMYVDIKAENNILKKVNNDMKLINAILLNVNSDIILKNIIFYNVNSYKKVENDILQKIISNIKLKNNRLQQENIKQMEEYIKLEKDVLQKINSSLKLEKDVLQRVEHIKYKEDRLKKWRKYFFIPNIKNFDDN